MKDIREYSGIYLAVGPTDLRKAVDGLAHIVRQDFQIDPFGNYLFLFCNKNRNKLKGLTWDENGFCMYYKRLDGMGAKFVWPSSPGAARDISVTQLEMLLNGMSVDPGHSGRKHLPCGFGSIAARDF